ncbi:MAG TPA: outer membrane lipoprotein carrier protein LolA, partial [Candidatus Deferrimicrobiaceae bacterium]
MTRVLKMTVRGAVAAIFLALVMPAAHAAGSGPSEGEALLEKVSAKYEKMQSLSAKFRQEVPLPNLGVVRKASGILYFARPSKMRWDYKKPNNQ